MRLRDFLLGVRALASAASDPLSSKRCMSSNVAIFCASRSLSASPTMSTPYSRRSTWAPSLAICCWAAHRRRGYTRGWGNDEHFLAPLRAKHIRGGVKMCACVPAWSSMGASEADLFGRSSAASVAEWPVDSTIDKWCSLVYCLLKSLIDGLGRYTVDDMCDLNLRLRICRRRTVLVCQVDLAPSYQILTSLIFLKQKVYTRTWWWGPDTGWDIGWRNMLVVKHKWNSRKWLFSSVGDAMSLYVKLKWQINVMILKIDRKIRILKIEKFAVEFYTPAATNSGGSSVCTSLTVAWARGWIPNLGALPRTASVSLTHIPSLLACFHESVSFVYPFFSICLSTCVASAASFVFGFVLHLFILLFFFSFKFNT